MPHITITALPQLIEIDRVDVMRTTCEAVAAALTIGTDDITATWIDLAPGAYLEDGLAPDVQPVDSHPPIITIDGLESGADELAVASAVTEAFPAAMPLAPGNVTVRVVTSARTTAESHQVT